jgi:predicted membrane-bound spermidine synthase
MRTLSPEARAKGSLVALGFAAAVVQALLLREAMAALGGSELAWGGVLAVWLAAMGAGAWAGKRGRGTRIAALGPTVVALLGAGGVVLLRATPALAGATAGETVVAWRAAWVWLAAVFPAALAGGWSFAALTGVRTGGERGGLAYALESGGAMLGGLAFTFLLAPVGSVATALAGVACALGAWILLRGGRWLTLVPLACAVVAVHPLDAALAQLGWRWSGRVGELRAWHETREERLEMAAGSPAAVYADGRLLGAFPDPYRAGARTHLALLLHPAPRRVLLVGGLADGSVTAALRHPISRLTVAEDDPALPGLLRRWIGGTLAAAFADERVSVRAGDAVRVVRSDERWDLIVLDDADPTTVRRNRTRTVEFFRACRAALEPGGVVVVRVGVGDTYLGGGGGRLLAVLAASLHRAFPIVLGVPGDEVLLVAGLGEAGLTLDPVVLQRRYAQRGVHDPDFSPEVIPLLVDPSRVAPLAAFLRASVAPADTAAHPRAVLIAAALHEARGSPPLLPAARALEKIGGVCLWAATLVAAVFLLARGAARARMGMEVGAIVGLASMAWWLLLLAAWQASRGAVYTEVGALSAVLMVGLATGAWWARGRTTVPHRRLAFVFVVGAALSGAVAGGAALAWPRTAIVPMLAVAGFLTGAAFPCVAALAAARDGDGAARGFAADEAGAAIAALAVGLVALPALGMTLTAVGVAVLQVAAALALLLAGRRRTA